MKDIDFEKLNKTQKMKIPITIFDDYVKVKSALVIPTRKKMNGYTLSAFFIQTKNGLWYRVEDYDAFSFTSITAHLKGDFEYNGIRFFLRHCVYKSYGRFEFQGNKVI